MAKSTTFVFGNSENGELGIGAIEIEHILHPRKQRLPYDRRKYSLVQIASGRNHTLFLLRNVTLNSNELFSCGSNERLQLGRIGSWKKLEIINALYQHNIIQIACGTSHCLVLSEAGQCFSWGCNLFTQLGHGNNEQQEIGKPSLIKKLATKNVIQVCCGAFHCIALTNTGELYTWGSNVYGQLGLGSQGNCISTPTLVKALQWSPIRHITAGGCHSAILTQTGRMYLWGKNEFGQLGLNDQRNRSLPTLQTSLKDQKIAFISLGDEHSAVLTDNGGLFTFGAGSYGQLGHSKNTNEILPRKVFELMGSCITQVSAGRCHTLAATNHGRVYSFGLGGSGQLGIGSTVSRNFPQCVSGPWVEVNVKDLLLRDGERSLCSITTLPHGIVNPLANVKVISDDSATSKSPLPTESEKTSPVHPPMEIDEVNDDENSASDNLGNDFIIEEPDDTRPPSPNPPLPGFICRNDNTVFTSQRLTIDEYESDPDSDVDELPQRKQLVLTEIVCSKGDQSFVITQQYSEKVSPKDFRQLEAFSEIAKLDNAVFENFQDVPKESLPLDIVDYIEQVISSIPCWNASYLNSREEDDVVTLKKSAKFTKFMVNSGFNLDDSKTDCGSIDWRQAFHGFNMIEEAQNDRINELMVNSVMKVLSNMPDLVIKSETLREEDAHLLHKEILRVYQLLPLFHMFRMFDGNSETSQALIRLLGKSILILSKEALKDLAIWWGCMPKHYFKSLIHIFKKNIEFNLSKQHEANKEETQVEGSSSSSRQMDNNLHNSLAICLDVLKLLYATNKMVETVSYREFYIDNLLSMFDLKQDFILWKRNELNHHQDEHANVYFLCNYPFIFDAPAKNLILSVDSEMQQQVAAERSVYQQILSSRPIDGQIYVNPYLFITVHRQNILQETINQLCTLNKFADSDFKKPLRVSFEGEEAVDAGQGMKKEFFLLLQKEILNQQYGMFLYKENNTIWFHHASFEESTMFHLIGLIAGLAIYNKVIINLPFPLVLYKKLLGETLELDDLAYLDPMLCNNLKEILVPSFGKEEFDAIFGEMNFTITLQTFGSAVEYELCSDGKNIQLTYENRQEYVRLYYEYILVKSIEKQFTSFRQGFMKVLDTATLTIFHAEELMQMVSGQEVNDWTELEAQAEYKPPFTKDHPTIQLFWRVFHSLTDEEKKKFLFFLSGSERIPILGVKALGFCIQPMKVSEEHLPVAHTCFNILDLPQNYTSPNAEAKLRSKLLKACEYGSTGFALV